MLVGQKKELNRLLLRIFISMSDNSNNNAIIIIIDKQNNKNVITPG